MKRPSATMRCPRCHTRYAVLADEHGDHDCPKCGHGDEDEEITKEGDVD